MNHQCSLHAPAGRVLPISATSDSTQLPMSKQINLVINGKGGVGRNFWLGMAKYKASKNDFRGGYELTQRYGEPVALPRVATNFSLQDLEKRFAAAHNNYGIGYELYRAQMQNGRVDDALLTARHISERPNSPAYFHFLEAQCWAEKQNWKRAWNAWLAFQAAQARATK